LISPPSDTVLKLLDSEVRQEIKAILHLVPSTATGFFYAPKNRGGLGIPRFEHIIKLGILKSAIKMNESIDPAVSGLINIDIQNKLKRIANSLRINWPASLDDIEKARRKLKGSHIQLWGDLRSQGQGVPDFSAYSRRIYIYYYTDAQRVRLNDEFFFFFSFPISAFCRFLSRAI
jgi:hypothetical protein